MDRIFHKTDCATLTIFGGMYSLASVTAWQSSNIGCFFMKRIKQLYVEFYKPKNIVKFRNAKLSIERKAVA